MKKLNSNTKYIFKWEVVQLFFFLIFLAILYFQEIHLVKLLNETSYDHVVIQKFLNELQFPLLPDYFYYQFFPLMLISASLLIFKRWRWFFLAFSGACTSILLISDRIYCSAFSSVITAKSFLLSNQIWDVKSAILESLTLKDILNICIFGIFIIFGIFYNKKMKMSLSQSKMTFSIDKILGILFFLLAIYCYNIAFYISKRYVLITTDNVMHVSESPIESNGGTHFIPNYESSSKTYAATFGILNFHIKNFTEAIEATLRSNKYKNSPPPKHFYSFFERKKKINEMKSPFYGIAKSRNVFLIHFESLHPLLIGLKIDGMPVTPTLNNLKETGLYFNHILDQVTMGGSSDAEFAVLTGLLPSTRKITALSTSCMPYIASLPRELKSKGYQTISLHGNVSSFYNRNISQPLLGFEYMYFKESYKMTKKIGMGICDKDFFSQSVNLLKKHQTPYFAFLMTLSSHYPYGDMPPEYQGLFNQTDNPDSLLTHYFQAIRYTDDALGEFFEKIKKSGLWKNSIFIIYGDHRPLLNDEMLADSAKFFGHSFREARYTCIPIIIAIPGQEDLVSKYKDQIQTTVGGLYDIYPTIMHLLGYEIPNGVFGTHLFVKNKDRDPVPTLRFMDSFVYNGIEYEQQGKAVLKDDLGFVFTNNVKAIVKSEPERFHLYQKALLSTLYCNYIYEIDKSLF